MGSAFASQDRVLRGVSISGRLRGGAALPVNPPPISCSLLPTDQTVDVVRDGVAYGVELGGSEGVGLSEFVRLPGATPRYCERLNQFLLQDPLGLDLGLRPVAPALAPITDAVFDR